MSTTRTVWMVLGVALGVGAIFLMVQLYPDLIRYLKMRSL
jgi:hypothetical protein